MRIAGILADQAFATKPQLAKAQAERGSMHGSPWRGPPATGSTDAAPLELRDMFERRGVGYVFAVGLDFQDSKQAVALGCTQVRRYAA